MTHPIEPPPLPSCPACGGQGERADRREQVGGARFIHRTCVFGVTLYRGTAQEWGDPVHVASRERLTKEQ